MRYYPIFLDIVGKPCLVIGGGEVAERKVSSLLEAGGRVTVISPTLTSRLASLAAAGTIRHLQRKYRGGDLRGFFLVHAATSDERAHQRIAVEAAQRGILLNVVDRPALCTFIVPAVVSRGDLTLAISTSGASPALAKRIRQKLEKVFGPEYDEALRILAKVRAKLRQVPLPPKERQKILITLAHSPLLDHLKAKRQTEVNKLLRQLAGEGFTLERLGLTP